MFTVKVRDSVAAGAAERLYSAETIEVVMPNDGGFVVGGAQCGETNWDEAGIYLDAIPPNPEFPGGRMAKHIILFGGQHSDEAKKRCGGTAWVMNEAGATVATYAL